MSFCILARYCLGEKHDDFCGSPLGEEMIETYCIEYRQIRDSLIKGAELTLQNWYPLQARENRLNRQKLIKKLNRFSDGIADYSRQGKNFLLPSDLREKSCLNRAMRKGSHYNFVKTGGIN